MNYEVIVVMESDRARVVHTATHTLPTPPTREVWNTSPHPSWHLHVEARNSVQAATMAHGAASALEAAYQAAVAAQGGDDAEAQ